MTNLDHRPLRYFIAVAEELHFGNAAKRLRMSQPPLSQQIAALEADLGVRLFERTKRKVELTPAGTQFLKDARLILTDLTKAATQARAASEGQTGVLRIGLNYSAPLHPAPADIFRHFAKQYPHVKLELHQYSGVEQWEGLLRNTLDIGFIFEGHDVPSDISLHPLGKDEAQLVVPKDHALAKKSQLSTSDLRDQNLFLVQWQTRTAFYDALNTACRKEKFNLAPRTDIIQIPFIMNMVAAGQGITFAPEFLGRIRPAGTIFRSCPFLPQAARHMSLSLAYRRNDKSILVNNFVAACKNSAL